MNKNNYIICKSVYFYSMLDEEIFFEWIKKINCIVNFKGFGDELYLYLADGELSYSDIKDLIALCYRYKINMKQLKKWLTESNKNAFLPWSKKIFGTEIL